MANYTNRRGADWVIVAIGCATLVLLSAVLVGLVLVYTVVSSQPESLAEPTPFPTYVIANVTATNAAEPLTNSSVISSVVSSPTPFVLEIVTATPTPSAENLAEPTASPTTEAAIATTIATAIPIVQERVRRNDIPQAIVQAPIRTLDRENLARLWHLDPPIYDYYDVAKQFGDSVGDRTVFAAKPELGLVRDFYVDEQIISAELVKITENVLFWMEEGYVYSPSVLDRVAERVESEIYFNLANLFGQEWRPGIDNDAHFSILHIGSIDSFNEIGFFNSVNQFPKSLDESSNEQEMIFLNMDQLEFGSEFYYATLAHELQHLIHWNLDGNESVWLNEGLSQLAEAYLGFDSSETYDYLNDTSLQLNTWEYEDDVIYSHYAASFLFAIYFWEQFGDEAVTALANSQLNSMASVRQVLSHYQPDLTLEEFLGNWAAANLIDEDGADGPYGYSTFRISFPDKHERLRDFPYQSTRQLAQYGVHYLDIRQSGSYQLTFAADTLVNLLPSAPLQGERVWYAPSNNDVAATLTRRFDLSATKSATLEFTAWYELERDFDFAYVSVSADQGRSWVALEPQNYSPGTYGPALTGQSVGIPGNIKGWIDESISLNEYVGQEILVRFIVLNDGAFSEHGFALASIGIPEINYLSTADERAEDWESAGFLVSGVSLPQQWSLQLVQGQTVRPIALDDLNQAEILLENDSQGATLIVMPQTPYVTEDATYWIKVEAK